MTNTKSRDDNQTETKPTIVEPQLSVIEKRVIKINAYKSLLGKKLQLRGVPKEVQAEIEKEYRYWLEAQMLYYMGEGRKEDPEDFSEEEKVVLKGFAQKMLSKAGQSQSQPSNKSIRQSADPLPPLGQKGLPSMIQRAGDVTGDKTRINLERQHDDFMRQLEMMDNQGPTY